MKRHGMEVHEHCFVRGPRAQGLRSRLCHSHAGGDVPHTHPDTGPSAYTIDKDEWRARTGLTGGGRKKFTAAPTGEQLPATPLTAEELSFDVVVVGDGGKAAAGEATGPGLAVVDRLHLTFGMRVRRAGGAR